MSSGPGLLGRAMSGFVALEQLRSELMSVAPVTVEGHVDVRRSGSPPGVCRCLRAMLPLGPC